MRAFIFFLIVSITSVSYSNKLDTTIFSTDYEKNIFLKISDSLEVDPLNVFIGFDYSDSKSERISNELHSIYSQLEHKGIRTKNIKKQIKLIYKFIHITMLKKYDDKAFFSDQFIDGSYNCLTATALYALVLDHFGITYKIKEMPTHVYIVGDPGRSNVLIETTLPSEGAVFFDDKFKKDYITYLLNNKIISQDEFNEHSIDYLFNEHYDSNKNISLTQLAALQYYNKGIFLYNELKYPSSAINFEKAYYLYPSNNIKYLYHAALANYIDSQTLDKKYIGSSLAKLLNLNTKNAQVINLSKNFFGIVSNDLVIEHPKIDEYKNYFEDFTYYLSDSIDYDSYSQIYYRILGYYDYSKGNYTGSLNWLNYAYISNPENIEVHELIETVSMKYIFTDSQHEKMIDTLEHYFEVFPFLKKKDNFQQYYIYCFSKVIEFNFNINKAEKSLKLLNRLESFLNEENYSSSADKYIENAYSSASIYYIEKRKYHTAMVYINRGKIFVPHSMQLRQQAEYVSMIKNYKPRSYSSEKYSYVPSASEQFKEKFLKYFNDCWKAYNVIEEDKTRKITSFEKLEIEIFDDRRISFTFRSKSYIGKWSLRAKSKLLYLVPARDKQNYLMFKIVEINKDQIKLRYYEKGKFNSQILVLEVCKN